MHLEWYLIILISWNVQFTVSQEFAVAPSTNILFPGDTNAVFYCVPNPSSVVIAWEINGARFGLDQLVDGDLPGHNVSGKNITVSAPVNGTKYVCVIPRTPPTPSILSDPAFLYIAGGPGEVFGVMVDISATTITQSTNLTITLTWSEPFSNFDPIINYTISCSGHPSCPQDITTSDNTTRYTIPNLLPETNYTFTVIATNSIDSGNAGTLMITSPSIPSEVTGASLICLPAETYNDCTAMWNPVIMGNGPLEQPLEYRVYYNGTARDVDNITTSLTFPFPPLPVGIYRDNIHLIVTAANRFGSGISSNTAPATVYGSSVTSVTRTASNRTNGDAYSATFNCTIHPDSDVEFCSVVLVATGRVTRENLGPVRDGQAEVMVTGLRCGVRYNITAEGRMSTSQAFVGFMFASNTTLPCAAGGAGGADISNVMMMIAAITIIMMCM